MSTASTGTNQSPAWSNAGQRSEGILPKVNAQLTDGERQALIAMRAKIKFAQRVGNVGGAAAVYYWMHVRNRGKYSLFSKIGFTAMGSLFAGALAMPVGIMLGQSDVVNHVEDHDHFRKVLETATRDRHNPRSAQTNQPPAPMSSTSSPPPSQQRTETNSGTNKWGDENFDDSALYSSNTSASASYDRFGNTTTRDNQTIGTMNNDSNPSMNVDPSQSNKGNPRWAELRGERNQNQGNSWDRIRSQSAQQPSANSDPTDGTQRINHRSAGLSSMQSSPGSADPSFGKGVNPQRAQAQRDYEASFERERRGIDG